MKPLKRVLNETIAQSDVLKAGRAQRAFKHWPAIVGDVLAKKSSPDRYSKGVLWVAVSGSAWAQELRMQREHILARLREVSGEPDLFRDIRFGIRMITETTHAAIEVEEPGIDAYKESIRSLSIREIAERRLKKLRNEEAD